ncbi:MAG: hypothetical protein MUF71_06480 [Candidatus Kapabacteria bacterium]|jgi:phosphopantothenoylcysteine decarboxylase/phosphopantothenate--cysteine ligase|nr:hypothetical protein [Candidatus Kapabacteria bacterium]
MNILLGISGSIAAYKAPLIVREILKRSSTHQIRVVMTPSATRFIPALTLQNLTKYPVAVEMFDENQQSGGSWHIHLARWCDVMMIAPCSAATLGKLAGGISDTALTTVALALPPGKPLLVGPAMDTEMWIHPATQRNCATLRGDGAFVIPPAEGELASGFQGVGRLPEPETLVDMLLHYEALLNQSSQAPSPKQPSNQAPSPKQPSNQAPNNEAPKTPQESFEAYNKRFEEYAAQLDPKAAQAQATSPEEKLRDALEKPVVNLQEGAEAVKFDAELELTKLKRERSGEAASAAQSSVDVGAVPFPLAGKNVLITAGPTYEKIDDVRFIGNYSSGKMGFALAEEAVRYGAKVTLVAGPVSLKTAFNLERIDVESAREMFDEVMKRRAEADVIILAAAVADFTPSEKHEGKIKKEDTGETLTLRLTKTPDILAAVGAVKGDKQVIVGFALEARNHLDNAQKKLVSKRADMIVLNALGKPQSGFDIDENTITILKQNAAPKDFSPMPKTECAKVILREAAEIQSA